MNFEEWLTLEGHAKVDTFIEAATFEKVDIYAELKK